MGGRRAAEESIPTNPWHTQQPRCFFESLTHQFFSLSSFSSLRASPRTCFLNLLRSSSSIQSYCEGCWERLTHGNLAKPTIWTFTYPSPKPKTLECRVSSTAKSLVLSSCANLKSLWWRALGKSSVYFGERDRERAKLALKLPSLLVLRK